jgi:hypothetical protein
MTTFEGLDECIIGGADVWHPDGNIVRRMVYLGDAIIAHLVKDGMTEDEAFDYCAFNIEGAWIGDDTPIICWTGMTEPDEDEE